MKKPGLTPKQERFCQEYVIDHNATQAAIRSGFSRRTAQEQSSRLLSKAIIQARVRELDDEAARRCHLSADYALKKLAEIIDADVAELSNPDGSSRSLREMPERFRKALNGIEWDDNGRPKVKLPDKNTALTNLLKHHKLISENFNLNVTLGFAEKLKRAREKRLGKDD